MEDKKDKFTSFFNIKNNLILKYIFLNLPKLKTLKIIRYNNKIKKRLNINLENYRAQTKIEIELEISLNNNNSEFINLSNFGNNLTDIYISHKKDDEKVKIIIEPNVLYLCGLFKGCECIKKLNL